VTHDALENLIREFPESTLWSSDKKKIVNALGALEILIKEKFHWWKRANSSTRIDPNLLKHWLPY